MVPTSYYPRSDMYRHAHHRPHDRAMEVIPRYEPDHYRPRDTSPRPPPVRVKHYKPTHPTNKELEVKIPERKTVKSDTENTELLQVVPKTRDCEDKHIPAPTGTSSPVEEDRKPPKKSLLESICSSLKKKESTEWTEEKLNKEDDEEEELDVSLKMKKEEKTEVESTNHHEEKLLKDPIMEVDENHLAQLKDELLSRDPRQHSNQITQPSDEQRFRERMTNDQLERRRRSNREAQRRRRARLKLQGHDGRVLEYTDEVDAKEKEQMEMRQCQLTANRPDSLYMSHYHDLYHHPRGSSPYHKERLHEQHYIHEKYPRQHRINPEHHYPYPSNAKQHHHPYHHPPPPPHYLYESPDYHHLPRHPHQHRHHSHHPSRYEERRDQDYSPRLSPTPPQNNSEEQSTRKSTTVAPPRETQQKGTNSSLLFFVCDTARVLIML